MNFTDAKLENNNASCIYIEHTFSQQIGQNTNFSMRYMFGIDILWADTSKSLEVSPVFRDLRRRLYGHYRRLSNFPVAFLVLLRASVRLNNEGGVGLRPGTLQMALMTWTVKGYANKSHAAQLQTTQNMAIT